MATRTLTPNRSVSRPLRVNVIAVLSILVIVVALGGLVSYAGSLSAKRALVMVTRDLPAGATLGPGDLVLSEAAVSDEIYQAAVPGTALSDLLGQELTAPVYRYQFLGRAQIARRSRLGPDQMALTIPVRAETAAGGRLRAGDQVQVLLTTNKGKPNSETMVVLERVTIYGVGHVERTAAIGATNRTPQDEAPIASLTLVVTAEQARALARAKHDGELDVALLPILPAAPGGQPGQ